MGSGHRGRTEGRRSERGIAAGCKARERLNLLYPQPYAAAGCTSTAGRSEIYCSY